MSEHDERLDAVLARIGALDGAEIRPAFGCQAMHLAGGMLGMAHPRGLVVRLPRERVEALKAEGVGEDFGNGGRVMREWVAVPPAYADRWEALADEAAREAVARAAAG